MKTFDWKEKYINNGTDITLTSVYVSLSANQNGTGTRNNPLHYKKANKPQTYIIGSGNYESFPTNATDGGTVYIGQGIGHTILTNYVGRSNTGRSNFFFKDMTVDGLRYSDEPVTWGNNAYFKNLIHHKNAYLSTSNCIFKNLRVGTVNNNNYGTFFNSTLIESMHVPLHSATTLFINTDVAISQSMINSYNQNYHAFNNCNFAIGNELKATPLAGNTADELRQNFVDRCTAQKITLKDYDEYGEKNKMGRWIFSSTSIIGEYDTLEESEIDIFAKKRGFYFGHTPQTYKQLPIVTAENIPNSFAPSNPRSLINIAPDSLAFNAAVDKRQVGYIDSKIIYLGGKHQITALNIHENLPMQNGVSVDSGYSFGEKTEIIEPDIHYIVRSTNTGQAKVSYNGVEYNSSLLERNNVFRGTTGVATFVPLSSNVMVLPIIDLVNHQTIQMRLVSDIPPGEIRGTSSLQKDYWYIVVPDNMEDVSGSITYKGIKHPCFDSFIADATANFTVNGACHLRRCWRKNYTESDETTDKTFWQSRQKPLYFDVIPNDLRALRKNNTITETEIMKDSNQQYIGSGHIDFYPSISGANGVKLPAFNLVGTFLQIQIPISTLNPM